MRIYRKADHALTDEEIARTYGGLIEEFLGNLDLQIITAIAEHASMKAAGKRLPMKKADRGIDCRVLAPKQSPGRGQDAAGAETAANRGKAREVNPQVR